MEPKAKATNTCSVYAGKTLLWHRAGGINYTVVLRRGIPALISCCIAAAAAAAVRATKLITETCCCCCCCDLLCAIFRYALHFVFHCVADFAATTKNMPLAPTAGISPRLSICLSVWSCRTIFYGHYKSRVNCDKMEDRSVRIFIPYKT